MELSHLDASGKPGMVDVGGKTATYREATAQARVELPEAVRKLAQDGDILAAKGPVFQTAMIAATRAIRFMQILLVSWEPSRTLARIALVPRSFCIAV